jgi:hypothetical protein
MRKPAIESRVGHARGIDDIVEPLLKKAVSGAKKGSKKVVKKGMNDVSDPKYKKSPYNAKGGMTKDYKDYVLRNSKGDY